MFGRMSIKRSKEPTRKRSREATGGFWEKNEPERVYSWEADVASQSDEAFVKYAPTVKFEKDATVFHSKFGKGIVTGVNGTKVEILFQEGPKTLAQNPSGGPPTKAVILAREALRGVPWKLDKTSYGALDEFLSAVCAYHATLGVSDAAPRADTVAIAAPSIDLVYEAADEGGSYDRSLTTTLVADDPTGFREGELLWKIHQALSDRDLADHCFFEGLVLLKDAERPVYSLLQGS